MGVPKGGQNVQKLTHVPLAIAILLVLLILLLLLIFTILFAITFYYFLLLLLYISQQVHLCHCYVSTVIGNLSIFSAFAFHTLTVSALERPYFK